MNFFSRVLFVSIFPVSVFMVTGICTATEPLEGMRFVRIPGGSFMMGSPASEVGRDGDEMQHRVTISAFEMMTTEVTQGMWMEVMGTTISQQRDLEDPDEAVRGKGATHPMYYVAWDEVEEFINRMNQRDPGHGYRLPTEAEWEYACRAGTCTCYQSGDDKSDLAAIAWYGSNSDISTHPVGQKTANAWGLYDMHGNVWEWCSDWYDSEYYADCLPSVTDPQGPVSGSFRVKRGGGWHHIGRCCRSAYRGNNRIDSREEDLGFRLVREAE